MTLPKALADCLIMNTVATSRALLKRWDARLKPYGVTVQQFFLLAAIRYLPGQPVMGLAERIALDRTSLTRNLDLLAKKGLIRRVAGLPGNQRVCELTAEGNTLLDPILEEWPGAYASVMKDITEEEAAVYLSVARRLAAP
ncbi:MarR family winged helix-turn-helix transcriptional regulator [Stappia indica]|uniref:MarR family winged helix-turn-helix transcriptional regulator n=1 Tax=Stappia indica TaxID=538381 RepID=UPI000830C752|nr:MarR family transcriptional regulator [Stappia indica]